MNKTEFQLEKAFKYNRTGAVKWIVSHLMQYPYLPALAVLGSVFTNLASSYRLIIIGQTYDLINMKGWLISALLNSAVYLVVLAVVQGLTALICYYSIQFIGQRIEKDARDELYVSLLGKSQTFHGQQRIGDIMARATNDVSSLNSMFSPGLLLIIEAVMAIAVPLVMIGFLYWKLLLIPIIFVILWTLTMIDYNNRLKPVSWAQHWQFGVMNASLAESINGIELVKGYCQEQKEKEKFLYNAGMVKDSSIKQGEIQARFFPMLVYFICLGGGLLHSLLLWRSGEISIGQVVAFVGLMSAFWVANSLSTFSFTLVQMGIAGAKRVLETINTETELDENVDGLNKVIEGDVEFSNVSFGFNGNTVLKNICFKVKPGETVAVVGSTGSGKTTLTRLINRIFDVESGQVTIDGKDVRDWNLNSLRSQISVIEQNVFLFSRSIAENIAFGCPDASKEQIESAACEAQAGEFIDRFSDGYDTILGERGVTLSGGQRQRIAIARAFLTNPRILIVDDSTSAIDSETEEHIQKAIKRVSNNRTTFIITHRLSQIRWADRILVLGKGELVDQGTHDELIERCQDYRNLFAQL